MQIRNFEKKPSKKQKKDASLYDRWVATFFLRMTLKYPQAGVKGRDIREMM